jgi:hypothetical protein
MHLLFLTLIINIILNLISLSNEDDCNIYNDCFNCVSCADDSNNFCECKWSLGSCISADQKIKSYLYFTKYCTDDNSKSISKQYCGESTWEFNDDNKIEFSMPLVGGYYGKKILYCEYTFTLSDDDKNNYYRIEYEMLSSQINNVEIILSIQYSDDTILGYLSRNAISRDFDGIQEIKLMITFKDRLSTLPFSFSIEKKETSKLILYITIAIIILACILCALFIYLISKKISQNARLRQRALFQLAMNAQRGDYNSEHSSAASGEVDVEEENKKKIEILLKTTLAKKIFTKNLGLKDGNTCTICIEDFKDKQSRVSITPCQHIFHYKCLSNWLINNSINPKCPNCNYNLLKDFNNQVNKEILNINANNNINVITSQGQNFQQTTSTNENNNLNSEENMNDTRIVRGRQPNRAINNNRNNTNNRNHRINQNTNTNANQNRGNNNNEIQDIEIHNV